MPGHLVKLTEELGFTRIEEIKLDNRLVFHGKVNGYPVDICISDDDLIEFSDKGTIKDGLLISGVINALVAELKGSGLDPFPVESTVRSGGSSDSKTPAWKRKASWECPVHGSKFIREFKSGSKFCSGYEVASEDDDEGPEWAKDEPSESGGSWKWFCKHKEANKS